jgi:hypothetical protein
MDPRAPAQERASAGSGSSGGGAAGALARLFGGGSRGAVRRTPAATPRAGSAAAALGSSTPFSPNDSEAGGGAMPFSPADASGSALPATPSLAVVHDGADPSLDGETAARRAGKWAAMLQQWDTWAPSHASKLKARARKGIPPSVRREAWLRLSGARASLAAEPGLLAALLEGALPLAAAPQMLAASRAVLDGGSISAADAGGAAQPPATPTAAAAALASLAPLPRAAVNAGRERALTAAARAADAASDFDHRVEVPVGPVLILALAESTGGAAVASADVAAAAAAAVASAPIATPPSEGAPPATPARGAAAPSAGVASAARRRAHAPGESVADLPPVPPSLLDTIERDLPRTFPHHSLLAVPGGRGQRALARLLVAAARLDVEAG